MRCNKGCESCNQEEIKQYDRIVKIFNNKKYSYDCDDICDGYVAFEEAFIKANSCAEYDNPIAYAYKAVVTKFINAKKRERIISKKMRSFITQDEYIKNTTSTSDYISVDEINELIILLPRLSKTIEMISAGHNQKQIAISNDVDVKTVGRDVKLLKDKIREWRVRNEKS